MRRQRSEIIARRSKKSAPLEKRVVRLEDAIQAREAELDHLNQAMQQASQQQDGPRIADLARAIHAGQAAIDSFFDELEDATHELERCNAVFETQLQALEIGLNDKE